jgi:hypothetical protein
MSSAKVTHASGAVQFPELVTGHSGSTRIADSLAEVGHVERPLGLEFLECLFITVLDASVPANPSMYLSAIEADSAARLMFGWNVGTRLEIGGR